jgi:hypothetical protein
MDQSSDTKIAQGIATLYMYGNLYGILVSKSLYRYQTENPYGNVLPENPYGIFFVKIPTKECSRESFLGDP